MADTGYSAGNLYLGIESQANNTLQALDAVIERLDVINQGLGKVKVSSPKKSGGGTKSGGGFLSVVKWTAVAHAAKRLGGCVAKIVQSGSAYTETLNLWETSMGNNLNVATEFVNKMNEAYGISEKTLMNAQAIFKNMLGSLGQISDSMAYSLSEGITQMALDYASLYNVTFEQAFTKFQAALAGQVRPIRSVAGYDITENTLFQLYQSLGGQKTMRQLSRTEKQLLAIYAVFKQMDASGAIGDLDKTMESFANQSRVMAEGWQRTMTYSGVILTHLIEQSGFMTNLNAVLIFLGDTLKAVAESMGAIKSFGDPFESTTDGALDASDAIDKVKGKLLDFDKFRSLSGQSENALGLDEKLLAALSNFDSILEGSSMAAKDLSDDLKEASGLFNENGIFQVSKWEEIRDTITHIGEAILIAFAIEKAKAIYDFVKAIDWAAIQTLALDAALKGLAIFAFVEAIEAFKDGEYALGILAAGFGIATLAIRYFNTESGKIVLNKILVNIANEANKKTIPALLNTTTQMTLLQGAAFGVVSALLSFSLTTTILDNLEGSAKQTASAWAIVVGVFATILGLILAIKGGLTGGLIGATVAGLGVGAILAGIKGIATKEAETIGDIPMHANGASNIDGGTLFVAGEMGKTEAVYTGGNGKTNVANVRQMEQAFYNALSRHSREGNGTIVVQAYLDGEKVYENTTSRAKSRGNVWAKA